jgi:hypothetical protein
VTSQSIFLHRSTDRQIEDLKLKMLDKEGIKKYVSLYRDILHKHQIIVTDRDLDNIYHLILLIADLDDLYDSIDRSPSRIELEKIEHKMIALMPDRQAIALDSIELIFEAIDEEAHADLSESLTRYLSVCGKSTGAQLVAGYLASKNRIELNIWLSDPIVKSNHEINDIIRMANDYLDVTVDTERMSEEASQIKAMNFFRCKFEFKAYLYRRYIFHKIRYYLYSIGLRYLRISSHRKDYLVAIECIESVLDFAVKAYITDKKSFREPER